MSIVLPRYLSCRELVELVTDYIEGDLGDDDRARFEEHLVGCGACITYVDQLRQTIQLTGQLPEDAIPPEAERALLDAFRGFFQAGA